MYQQITNYQPYNEQEAKDKELLLKVLKQKEVVFCKERFVRVYIKPSNDLPDEEIKIT